MVAFHNKEPAIYKAMQEVEDIDLEALSEAGIRRAMWDYYLWGTYPPLIAMGSLGETDLLRGNRQKEFDVYIHIPFCGHECGYCHFYHVTSSEREELMPEDGIVSSYLEALHGEIAMLRERITGEGRIRARSIYIGGGTPSFLGVGQIRSLLERIKDNFDMEEDGMPVQFTVDVHPRIEFRDEKLGILQGMGVNRISIGGVDLDDRVLRAQNRGHSGRDVIGLIADLKGRGFPHIVTDLIMGLPSQTPESWIRTIKHLIDNSVDCIMAFPLMLKATARLCARAMSIPEGFPTMKERMVMQLLATDILERAGYHQYPIFYFNRGQEHGNRQQIRKSRSIEDAGLLAIGVSSFGFLNDHQYYNTPCIEGYIRDVKEGRLPVWRGDKLTRRELFERALIFGLRSGPIDKLRLQERYRFDVDREYAPVIRTLQGQGLLESSAQSLRLTRLGTLFADEISTKFASERMKRKAEKNANEVPARHHRQVLSFAPMGHKGVPGRSSERTRACRLACSTCRLS